MISTLDRYILRQVLAGTVFSVLALTGILVLGNIFKEIRPFLVEKGLPITFVGTFILYLLPFALVLIIPWSFLASVLMTFGKLSGSQEVTAMRSAGRSLYRIAAPVFGLGLLLSGFSFWLNASISPHSKAALKQMVHEVGMQDPMRFFDPGVVQSRLKGQRIYIEERPDPTTLKGFHVYQLREGRPSPAAYLYAETVSFDLDTAAQRFDLRLNDGYAERISPDGQITRFSSGEGKPFILPYSQRKQRRIKPDQLDNQEIAALLANPPAHLEPRKLPRFAFEAIRRYAFSAAPLALCFIAVPLALQSRRKDNSRGIIYTLGIAFTYFILTEAAKGFYSDEAILLSHLYAWIPNLICFGTGLFLFRKATRTA